MMITIIMMTHTPAVVQFAILLTTNSQRYIILDEWHGGYRNRDWDMVKTPLGSRPKVQHKRKMLHIVLVALAAGLPVAAGLPSEGAAKGEATIVAILRLAKWGKGGVYECFRGGWVDTNSKERR